MPRYYVGKFTGEGSIEGLRQEAVEWHQRVIAEQIVLGYKPFRTLSFENQVRLLNLKRWCQRYHVGLPWILSRLYEHYDRQRWAPRLINLCGSKSRSIIEEALNRNASVQMGREDAILQKRLEQAKEIVPQGPERALEIRRLVDNGREDAKSYRHSPWF